MRIIGTVILMFIFTGICAALGSAGVLLWFIGVAYLVIRLITTVKEDHQAFKSDIHNQSKLCPECAESVKAAALVCRFCRHKFDTVSTEMATVTPLLRQVK